MNTNLNNTEQCLFPILTMTNGILVQKELLHLNLEQMYGENI